MFVSYLLINEKMNVTQTIRSLKMKELTLDKYLYYFNKLREKIIDSLIKLIGRKTFPLYTQCKYRSKDMTYIVQMYKLKMKHSDIDFFEPSLRPQNSTSRCRIYITS